MLYHGTYLRRSYKESFVDIRALLLNYIFWGNSAQFLISGDPQIQNLEEKIFDTFKYLTFRKINLRQIFMPNLIETEQKESTQKLGEMKCWRWRRRKKANFQNIFDIFQKILTFFLVKFWHSIKNVRAAFGEYYKGKIN